MELRVYDADPERVERIRARCVSALARRRETEPRGSGAPAWSWLEPAVAVAVCGVYLAEAVARALAFLR